MARIDLKKSIYSDLSSNTALLTLLGPVTEHNRRIYLSFPQEVPRLSGNNASEGWLIFYEEQSVILWSTIQEQSYFDFHIYATTPAIGEDAIDILDTLYHWRIAGQNSRVISDYNVVYMQRIHCLETYDETVKLYRKIGRYRFQLVKTPFSL